MKKILVFLMAYTGLLWAEPRPPKEVFIPHIEQRTTENGFETQITINFPEHYYLYADKTSVNGEQNYQATPTPEEKQDTYLGLTHLWTQSPTLTLHHSEPTQRFELKTQGCEKDVICYPPMKFELAVADFIAPTDIAEATHANEPNTADEPLIPVASHDSATPMFTSKKSALLKTTQPDEFLSTEEAFTVSQSETDEMVNVQIQMPDESYYLYRSSIGVLIAPKRFVPELNAGEAHHDPFLGEQEIYRGGITFHIPKSQLSGHGEALLEFQGCAEGRVCYPKTSKWLTYTPSENPAAEPPATPLVAAPTPTPKALSDDDASFSDRAIENLHAHFFSSLPLIFLIGVLMAFTACVYPLIPIVSSVVVGKEVSGARAYRLIGAYVVGMGSALALLGALFAVFELNLQLLLQKTWVVIVVALIFGALSLSMFGAFTFQAPAWLQTKLDRLSRKQQTGSYSGSFIMGALSVLMVSACSTPILTALLLYASQTNPIQGALALFVYGIGQGTPLFLFASALKRFMPKSGLWMNTVKTAFAFMLLGITVWLLARIASESIQSAWWGGYLLLLAVFLLPQQLPQTKRDKALWFGFLLALMLSLVQFQRAFAPTPSVVSPNHTDPTTFQTIASKEELQSALAASDKPVLLDFFAQWCVSCHKWEKEVWQHPELQADLKRFTLLKVDLTDTTDAHHQLLQALNLVGPPAVLYYSAHAPNLSPNERLVGESSMGDFRKKLAVWR